jgi:Ca2+-binding RTX toxin-like protein
LQGGTGADHLDGAPGHDLASYGDSDEGVTVRLWAGDGTGGTAQGDTLTGIEDLSGSDFGDTLVGDEGDNRLFGGAGPDALWGNSGDDVLIGGAGGDALFGQAGFDTASYEGSGRRRHGPALGRDGTLGATRRATGSTGSRPCGVPTMPTRWSAMRVATAEPAGTVRTRFGATRATTRCTAARAPICCRGRAASTGPATWAPAARSRSGSGTAVGRAAMHRATCFRGIENLLGSDHADTLVGDVGDNVLRGEGGDDALWGNSGDDTLEGGAGADALHGQGGVDWASYARSETGVTVRLWAGDGVGGDATGDTLSGIENLRGSDHADTLVGDGGDEPFPRRSGD